MSHRKQASKPEITQEPVASPRQLRIWRFVFALFFAGFGALLIGAGKQALQTRSVNFEWKSTLGGASSRSDQVMRKVSQGTVQLRGSEAVEHGVGLFAGGVTLSLWSILLLWSVVGRQASDPQWRGIHSLATFLSLVGVTATMIGFFPPWHIPYWPSCDALYFVLLFFGFLVCLGNRKRILYFSKRGFPALILAGILIGQIWVGVLAGTIAGIFLGIGLGVHVVSLIPSLREKARKSYPKRGELAPRPRPERTQFTLNGSLKPGIALVPRTSVASTGLSAPDDRLSGVQITSLGQFSYYQLT